MSNKGSTKRALWWPQRLLALGSKYTENATLIIGHLQITPKLYGFFYYYIFKVLLVVVVPY